MKLSSNPEINAYNVDCMEFMREKPDNYYDLAIVDPPYGIGDVNQKRSRVIHGNIKWNDSIPVAEYFNTLERVSKNQIIWGCNYYTEYILATGRIVHDKVANTGKQLDELSDADLASHSFGVNIKIFRYGWRGNVQGDSINWKNDGIDGRIHPTQKPVALYRWLLKNYAKDGDRILDTHGGSFSSAIACYMEGFDLDIIELDEDYFNDAIKRFKLNTIQETMF